MYVVLLGSAYLLLSCGALSMVRQIDKLSSRQSMGETDAKQMISLSLAQVRRQAVGDVTLAHGTLKQLWSVDWVLFTRTMGAVGSILVLFSLGGIDSTPGLVSGRKVWKMAILPGGGPWHNKRGANVTAA